MSKGCDQRNILVFFCDQLRLDILRCYGGQILRTPNLDALAQESCVFERAYTPTALCSPARASLMTGLYPHRHYLFANAAHKNYCPQLRPEVAMISDWADRCTDYQSAYTGKWHLGSREHYQNSGFHVKKFMCNTHSQGDWPSRDLLPDLRAGTLDMLLNDFSDVRTADDTQAFLRERDRRRPFLAFCAFPGPHAPWRVPAEFGIRYNPDDMPDWPNRHDSLRGKPLNQRKTQRRRKTTAAEDQGADVLKHQIACHMSYMELIDGLIGDVLRTLRDTGCYDNTTIIFTADHGDMLGAHGFLSKGAYMYDEIYRIPLLIRDPARPARRIAAPVHLMDVTATMMHVMAGRPCTAMSDPAGWDEKDDQTLQGESLLPLMDGNGAWSRRVHYAQYHADWYGHYTSRMVTDGRYKVIWNPSDLCEMYDLAADPHELENVFYREEYRQKRDEYYALLVAEARRLKDERAGFAALEVEKTYPL